MENVILEEDTYAVITLLGSDDYFGENANLQGVITAPIFGSAEGCQNLGYLYQYDAAKALPGGYTEADRITVAGTAVTDSQNRVVYIPPASHFNSDANVPYRFIRPYFKYKMVETNAVHDPKPLESNEVQVEIIITPVNDAPTVITDADVDPAVAGDFCWNANCRVPEDLGKHYRETAGTVGLWFGGDDVERSTLDILITRVECPADALLQTIEDVPQSVPRSGLSDASPFVLPTKIELYQPLRCSETLPKPPLIQALSFAPALDAFSTAGNFYCKVTYRVRDNLGAVSASKDIVISVDPINDVPRATEYVKKVEVFESDSLDFTVTSFDVEGDTYKMEILSCDDTKGRFFLRSGRTVPILCKDAPMILTVVPTPDANGKIAWPFTFTPNPGENQPVPYNELRFQFPEDSTGTTPGPRDLYIVEVTVLPRNSAPDVVLPSEGQVTTDQQRVAVPVSITDIDVDAATTAYEFTATIELVGTAPSTVLLQNAPITLPWTMTVDLPTLNQILTTMEVKFSQTRSDETITLRITANDNGAVGNCRDADGNLFPCSLSTSEELVVRFRTNRGIVGTAVGAGSAIGAGAAAVLAALAYRRFRKREDKFQPWTFNQEDEGAFENPLYTSDAQKENPLYEFTSGNAAPTTVGN
jgi:hypothetical protein